MTVPRADPKVLGEAILHALASPEDARRMQKLARRRAEERFTADSMVNATLAVYRELAGMRDQG